MIVEHLRDGPLSQTLFSVIRLGDFLTLRNFLRPLATINLPESSTFSGNFYKGGKIILLWATFIDIWQFLSGHTGAIQPSPIYQF